MKPTNIKRLAKAHSELKKATERLSDLYDILLDKDFHDKLFDKPVYQLIKETWLSLRYEEQAIERMIKVLIEDLPRK